MPRALKFCGLLILNTLTALIGTAVLETSLGKVFRPHSLATFLWKEWSLSIFCAALIGFFMWRTWKTSATKWVWVIPSLWFAMKFVPDLFVYKRQSILIAQFSGSGCNGGRDAFGCRVFLLFTIPFVRSISYSLGAYCSSLVSPSQSQSPTEPSALAHTSPPA